MYLDELTMKEFKEQVNDDSVVILPLGAVEEHGSHLPLNTDSIQPEFVAEEVAKRTGALIAPPIRYGLCSSTRKFPGTLSLTFDTLGALTYDILSELARNGFKNIVVLSGHAGRTHMAALQVAAEEVVEECDVKLMVLSDYDIAYELEDLDVPEGDGHSGKIETSRVMAIRPELVKGEGIDSTDRPPKFMVLREPHKHFESGVMGHPSQASAEFGKELNDIIIERLVELINEMKATKVG